MMYHFEFMKAGQDWPFEAASGEFRTAEEAKAHCRSLFEGRGKVVAASRVCLRENCGPIMFCWPEPA
jgi:hypothetical protein